MHLDFFRATIHQIEMSFLSVAQMSEVDPLDLLSLSLVAAVSVGGSK